MRFYITNIENLKNKEIKVKTIEEAIYKKRIESGKFGKNYMIFHVPVYSNIVKYCIINEHGNLLYI